MRVIAAVKTFDPKLHKVVKKGIRPAVRTAASIRLGDRFLSEEETSKAWPEFLQAQVSWHGPRSAASIIHGHNHPVASSSIDEFDDSASREAAKKVRQWQKSSLPNCVQEAAGNFFAFHEL